jgi:iron complex transport system substrate-binding protein
MASTSIKSSGNSPPNNLRIASLLPSTTDICISLGLKSNIVGITHECDGFSSSSAPFLVVHPNEDDDVAPHARPRTLTVSHIDPHTQTQSEIDTAVKTSLYNGISLYNLNDTSLADSKPSIILTQSLCEVCAVAKDEVDREVACTLPTSTVLSLEPESLEEVAGSFITVGEACGVMDRGEKLHSLFWEGVDQVFKATSKRSSRRPTIMFMEWLDPPFDGGHWIPDMIERSGCSSPLPTSKPSRKSVQLTWEQVYECDPDVVIIGCCGFDLRRNEEDAQLAMEQLKPLRAFREGRIYAADGNLYFARPGPALREGIAIMARCGYDGEKEVVEELEGLGFLPKEGEGWRRLVLEEKCGGCHKNGITDVEDLVGEDDKQYATLHDEACLAGKDFYKDPKTGYNVFTELAHKKRGKCCGSGCRHCPYNHINVKDKSKRIQQPAFLFEGVEAADGEGIAFFTPISAIPPKSHVKVLFFSGGKDSFLTIRKLVKQQLQSAITNDPFQLILLTTFDSSTRIIAHQEIPIDTVLRQATHLGIPLLAIPLRRGSGETYLNRIERGLDAIRERIADIEQISLVFGDLHLDHIREWREKELSTYPLEYPLWKTPYDELMDDLEASKIRVVLSAATKDGVHEGMVFTRKLWNEVISMGMDGFGENGEFHSVAEVWATSREQALGLTNGATK